MQRLLDAVRKSSAEFGRDRRGNVAVVFSLAVLPLIAFVGAAIDFSHANSVKTAFQNALDSTALMLSKEAANETSATLQSNATNYFNALFNEPTVGNIRISAAYTTDGGSKVTVNGSADVPTSFLRVMNMLYPGKFSTITIGGTSTAAWGSNRLRVALVLDNTGSMTESGKIGALKTATKSLLDQLKSAASMNGDVYVSIIPFVKDVNVGAANYNANWIDWNAMQPLDGSGNPDVPDGSVGAGSSCPYSNRSDGFTCVTTPGGSRSASTIPASVTVNGVTYTGPICPSNSIGCYDSVPQTTTVSSCNGRSNCTCSGGGGGGGWGGGWGGGGGSQTCTQTTYSHTWFVDKTQWTGCVADRGNSTGPDTVNNYDTNVGQPTVGVSSSLYPAEQYSACPSAAVMPLSYDWSAMTSLVNNMSANGSTNQAIGLQLGWMSLVGGGPFPSPPTEDSNYKYSHIIILLTDGLNTQNRWYGNGSSVGTSDDAKIDAREEITCNNFKAASTTNTLYTIQVNTGGDPTSTLLQRCASSSDKFFLLTSASQILTTFQTIGTNLTQLRIAK